MDSNYEMPWRPNYEWMAAIGWILSAASGFGVQFQTNLPLEPFLVLAGTCGAMAGWRGIEGWRVWRRKALLSGRPIEFITHKQLDKRRGKKSEEIYVGRGFEWTQREAQRLHEIQSRDPKEIKLPVWRDRPGAPWIHGIGEKEEPIRIPLSLLEGHMGIFGTTGAGKTRLFDLLITQAIRRGESVIVLDPKCDAELMRNAKKACEMLGDPDRFVLFHPARPEESARINTLKNYNRATELATRIAALIPSETGADPFKAFGQRALNNVVQGLLMVHQVPTLAALLSYLEGGVDGLAIKTIEAFGKEHFPDFYVQVERFLTANDKRNDESRRRALTRFYRERIKPLASSPDLEGLLSMAEHNREHLGKMIASLLPILGMLTSGHIGPLLSPNDEDVADRRDICDLKGLIESRMVLYVALDSLSDSMVGSAIGSMLLSDLTAVAGDRYNFIEGFKPVNIFIDESAEVINTGPFIQMLNKGRGAFFRLALATQTLSDFVVRTGSEDAAFQVLGNINNWISLRVVDGKTQEYFAERLPKTKIKYIMRTQGSSMGDGVATYGANAGERLMEEEADAFPAALMGKLPNLEYIACVAGGTVWKGRLPILLTKEPT